jgi:hypothetical protein
MREGVPAWRAFAVLVVFFGASGEHGFSLFKIR